MIGLHIKLLLGGSVVAVAFLLKFSSPFDTHNFL